MSDYSVIEFRLQEALETLQECQKPNTAATARNFEVPEQRLRAR